MTRSDNKRKIEQASEELLSFAIDRSDVKSLVARLPQEVSCKPSAVEYELQLLKIISTGWSISYFLENFPCKKKLAEAFWKEIHGFAENLSDAAGIITGQNINYFQIVKDRLDMYVTALADKPEAAEPVAVIGPEFARHCGDADDVFTIMTGSRMFLMTVASVREYLNAADIVTNEH